MCVIGMFVYLLLQYYFGANEAESWSVCVNVCVCVCV